VLPAGEPRVTHRLPLPRDGRLEQVRLGATVHWTGALRLLADLGIPTAEETSAEAIRRALAGQDATTT
jgi:hypothetical protein